MRYADDMKGKYSYFIPLYSSSVKVGTFKELPFYLSYINVVY